jgi:hypothetical protein
MGRMLIKMVTQKEVWEELDELGMDLQEWREFLDTLLAGPIRNNDEPVFGDRTPRELVKTVDDILVEFTQNLALLNGVKTKWEKQLKEKYLILATETQIMLNQLKRRINHD